MEVFIVIFILLLLAQYTEKDGLGLGGLFDFLKVNVKDFEETINKFRSIEDFKEYTKDGVINWDNLSKSIGITDTRLRSYLETLDDGKGNIDNTSASVEGMSAYLKKSGNAFKFAAIKATLLNTALNAGIFLVTSFAIQAVVKGIDNFIHRVDKANEAMDEAVSEYETAKSELENINSELTEQNKKLDELLAKDKLTYAEQGQLEELQEITKELLLQQDIAERNADRASKEAADKTVNAYKTQYGRYDTSDNI